MNDISLLNNDKEKYNEMKDALNRVIQYLNDAIDNLESASSTVSLSNIVNDVRADGDKVRLYKENLVNQVNWLKNTILPAIDNSINNCNTQIDKLMAAIVAASTVTTPIVQVGNSFVERKEPSKTTVSNPKITVTTVPSNKKITTSTPVNNMATRNKVSTSTVNIVKSAVTKIGSLLGRLRK